MIFNLQNSSSKCLKDFLHRIPKSESELFLLVIRYKLQSNFDDTFRLTKLVLHYAIDKVVKIQLQAILKAYKSSIIAFDCRYSM